MFSFIRSNRRVWKTKIKVEPVTEPPPSLTCPDGFTPLEVGEDTRCYKYFSNPTKIEEAIRMCAELAPENGNLLVTKTDAERMEINAFVEDSRQDDSTLFIWVGAYDYDGDKTFIWGNGVRVTQEVREMEGESCAVNFVTNLKVFSNRCDSEYTYVCEASQVLQ